MSNDRRPAPIPRAWGLEMVATRAFIFRPFGSKEEIGFDEIERLLIAPARVVLGSRDERRAKLRDKAPPLADAYRFPGVRVRSRLAWSAARRPRGVRCVPAADWTIAKLSEVTGHHPLFRRRLLAVLCVNSHNLPGRNVVSFRRCK